MLVNEVGTVKFQESRKAAAGQCTLTIRTRAIFGEKLLEKILDYSLCWPDFKNCFQNLNFQ